MRLKKKGLLKSQADLLAKLAKNPKDLERLASENKVLDLMTLCQKFVSVLIKDKAKAYLEVNRLNHVASEKSDQDTILKLLTFILANNYSQPNALHYLDALYQARLMWQSNVSFQNSLEYMVLS